MRKPCTLIVYGSSHGQTAKIARWIAGQLVRAGHNVSVMNGDGLDPDVTPDGYDLVVVGASVQMGRHQRYIEQFVRRHRALLERAPSAFFSVSGSKASPDPKYVALADEYVRKFLLLTGWHPLRSATFAGAVAYTKYNPLLRWFMKRISAKTGRSTDTSRDHELTDWREVAQFAAEVAGLVRVEEPAEVASHA